MIASSSHGALQRNKSPDGFEDYNEKLSRAAQLNVELGSLRRNSRNWLNVCGAMPQLVKAGLRTDWSRAKLED